MYVESVDVYASSLAKVLVVFVVVVVVVVVYSLPPLSGPGGVSTAA